MDMPSGYTYLKLSSTHEDVVSFRIKEVTDKSSADAWKEKLAFHSKVTWRINRTYPKSGRRNVYKVDLKCQHAHSNKTTGVRSSKQTNCEATLQISVRRFNEKQMSREHDPLDSEWPTLIIFKGVHNHPINSAESLRYRDLSSEGKEKLLSLFQQGHDPGSALQCLKTDLLLQHGENYFKVASDGYYVPSRSVVEKLFTRQFHGQTSSNDDMLNNLSSMLKKYCQSTSGRAKICKSSDGDNYFVVMCTPIMMRAHSVQQAAELVMVDAAGGMDKQRHRLYFFITPTAAGGLPIAAIVTDTEKASLFQEALVELKSILPENSFHGEHKPKVFLTDNDLKEKGPLQREFPESRLLLCQFHFLKAVWSWLCNKNHGICATERQEIYFLVKDVLYAQNETTASEKHLALISSAVTAKYHKFLSYYNKLWQNRQEWATFTRQNVILRGNNTTNYVEVVFRIMKDCILQRVMAFNLNQLVHFILTRYEMYMQKRLLDFSNEKCFKNVMTEFLPKEKWETLSILEKNESNDTFKIKDSARNTNYMVDMKNGICTCSAGQTGKVCKHVSYTIANIHGDVSTSFNIITRDVKRKMFFIATGNEAPDDWFEPLRTHENGSVAQAGFFHLAETNVSTSETGLLTGTEDSLSPVDEPDSSLTDKAGSSTVNELSSETVSEVQFAEFDTLCSRMRACLVNNPALFKPALESMLKNKHKYTTESGLATAMHTFGSYHGLKPVGNKFKRKSHSKIIGVQPTTPGRRVRKVSTQNKTVAQKIYPNTALACHDYTTFGSLPPRKKKALHNLQDCVYANKKLAN